MNSAATVTNLCASSHCVRNHGDDWVEVERLLDGEPSPLVHRADFDAAVAVLVGRGMPNVEIALHLNVITRAVERARARNAEIEETYVELQAHTEKDRKPYKVNVGPKHKAVLLELNDYRHDGLTDAELTMTLRLHMAAARRCELRDAGAIRRAGRRNGSWVWKLTKTGIELIDKIKAEETVAA